MDENQIEQLGRKMRDAYTEVASEAPVPAEVVSKHPSRRLRKNRTFAAAPIQSAASASGSALGSLVRQHPMASLLVAVGVGYLLARL